MDSLNQWLIYIVDDNITPTHTYVIVEDKINHITKFCYKLGIELEEHLLKWL